MQEINRDIPLHHIKLSHQLTSKNLNLKVDHHARGKWFIHGPKTRTRINLIPPVAQPGTPLLIILSILVWYVIIVCKSHTEEVQGSLSNPFLKDSPRTETPYGGGYVQKQCSTHQSIHTKKIWPTSGTGQAVFVKGRPPEAISSPISRAFTYPIF